MNQKLTQKLRNEFPILFGENAHGEFLRGYSFEIEDGWYELVREFAFEAEKHSVLNPNAPIVAIIVKEKFGQLCIQGLSNMTNKLSDFLCSIEAKSRTICELCGDSNAQLSRKTGWIFTRCKDCKQND